MALFFSHTLARTTNASVFSTGAISPALPCLRLVPARYQSSHPWPFQPIDPTLVESPPSSSSQVSVQQVRDDDMAAVQRIEDVIHGIIARRSAPDWLPFYPGSSYWVPPRRRSYGVAKLVQKLANALTEEETMSLTTGRGWPSSQFYIKGASSPPSEVEASSRNVVKVSQFEEVKEG